MTTSFFGKCGMCLLTGVLIGLLAASGKAQQAAANTAAKGIVVYGKEGATPDEYASVTVYSALDHFGNSLTATLLDGRTQFKLVPPYFKAFYNYPELSSITLTAADDLAQLEKKVAEAESMMNRYPKSRSALKSVVQSAQSAIETFRSGQVAVNGKWMSVVDHQKLLAASSPLVITSFAVGTSAFKNARLASARNGEVRIMHDGGLATVSLQNLTDAQKAELAHTNPSVTLAGTVHQDLAKEVTGNLAPAVRMPSPAPQATPAVTNGQFSAPGVTGALSAPAHTLPLPGHPLIDINATGTGTTSEEALRDAFRDATHQAVGTFISAEQIVKNEELLRDQVIAHSDGFIQGYDITNEKLKQGLFHVSIHARVARGKLAQQLSKSGLIDKTEVEGENMFAEAITKLDKSKSAKELLAKLFEGFPQSVCRAAIVGKPAIVSQDDATATLRLRIRVGVDTQAYAAWYQNAIAVLRQVSQKVTPFLMPRDEVAPKEFDRAFGKLLHANQDPLENDDIKVVRFNASLDGLIPIQQQNKLSVDVPNSGMMLLLSKSLDGFSGEAFLLGEEEYQAITTALTEPSGRSESKWHVLDSIKVDFKDAAGQNVRDHRLELYHNWAGHRFESVMNWPAPYGTIEYTRNQYGTYLAISERAVLNQDDNRMLLIRPGFILDHIYGIESIRKQGPPWVVIATAGAAVDFKVTVPLEDMRRFHHIELSLEAAQK